MHKFLLFLFLWGSCFANLAEETVFLTWQRNPATTMTIQWISPASEKKTEILYRSGIGDTEWQLAIGESFPFPSLPQYFIHRIELHHLRPDYEYAFKIDPSSFQEFRFLTAPIFPDKEVRFVVGGDMYHGAIKWMENTSRKAAAFDPLFAIVGGDIAYSVHSHKLPIEHSYRWIEWIKSWHHCMATTKGRLIPVVAAIGNHDIIYQYNQTPEKAAVFCSLFPMPGFQVYNALDFGTYLSIILLDSGHAHPIEGKQSDWLFKTLENRKDFLHRFAVYHVPAYPCIRHSQKQSMLIQKHWTPIFEKGGIQAAFEHHDHAYKRTHPLINNRIDPAGILYLGDGCWGVEKPRKMKKKRSYIAKFLPVRHFIGVTLTTKTRKFQCIDDQGKVLDECIQPTHKPNDSHVSTSQSFAFSPL